jgi:hypothetical protein
MRYLLLLLMTGCATQSLDDLYLERATCVSQKVECGDIEERIAKKEMIRQWHENTEMHCPDGYIAYCDSRWNQGCGRKASRTPVKYSCKTRESLRGIYNR